MKKKILIVSIFILIIILFKSYELDRYFSFENLKIQKEILNEFVQNNYLLTVGIFIIVYIINVSFMLPTAGVISLSSGVLFGTFAGAVFSNIAATLGAIVAFLFARYIIGNKLQEKYKDKLESFNKGLSKNKYKYLFSLRLLPIFPFFMVNFLCGITKIDLKTYIITTSIGIIPGAFVFSYAGSQIGNLNSIDDIFTKDIFLAFIFLVILIFLPSVYKKLMSIIKIKE